MDCIIMPSISTMAHNEYICRDVEQKLNGLIDMVNAKGGCLYLVSSRNKDFTVKLNEHVGIAYFVNVDLPKEDE